MNIPEIISAEQFFLDLSRKKKHPNFIKLKKNAMENNVVPLEIVKDTAKKGNAYKHTRSGFRSDLGINVRSNWEANFARVLNAYNIKFSFEPVIFSFPITRGTKSYTPDFYMDNSLDWVEIKGYLDDKSKIKLKRFKRYYEEDFNRLTFIISKYSSSGKSFAAQIGIPKIIYYEDIRSFYIDKIPNWEGK